MTRTIIGKFDYEGDEARIEGDAVPTRKMICQGRRVSQGSADERKERDRADHRRGG